jgi:hypothetical protein
MNTASSIDPEIARMVGSLLTSSDPLDRRGGERLAFPSEELVAYFVDGAAPDPGDFASVACGDLSEEGISFYWPTVPPSDMAIVGLLVQGELTYLLAEVRSCTAIAGVASGKYRIGCRFIKRIEKLEDARSVSEA